MASTTYGQSHQMSLPGFGAVPPSTIANGTGSWPYISGSGTTLNVPNNNSYTISSTAGIEWDNLKPNSIEVKGKAKFDHDVDIKGTLVVGGRNLNETLEAIEQRLGILRIDPAMEERWETLKKLGDEYRALEQDIFEKEEIIRILKK